MWHEELILGLFIIMIIQEICKIRKGRIKKDKLKKDYQNSRFYCKNKPKINKEGGREWDIKRT